MVAATVWGCAQTERYATDPTLPSLTVGAHTTHVVSSSTRVTAPAISQDEDVFDFVAAYDTEGMYLAVEHARADDSARCLAARGLDEMYAYSMLSVHEAQATPGGDRPVTRAIAVVETQQPRPHSEEPDDLLRAGYAACYSDAAARLPNPNETWMMLLQQIEQDVSSRIAADPRIAVANEQREACLASTGVSTIAPDGLHGEPIAILTVQAQSAVDQYLSGVISRAVALDQLGALGATEDLVVPCYEAARATERTLSDEHWREALAGNEPLVVQIQQALAPQAAIYEDYLSG